MIDYDACLQRHNNMLQEKYTVVPKVCYSIYDKMTSLYGTLTENDYDILLSEEIWFKTVLGQLNSHRLFSLFGIKGCNSYDYVETYTYTRNFVVFVHNLSDETKLELCLKVPATMGAIPTPKKEMVLPYLSKHPLGIMFLREWEIIDEYVSVAFSKDKRILSRIPDKFITTERLHEMVWGNSIKALRQLSKPLLSERMKPDDKIELVRRLPDGVKYFSDKDKDVTDFHSLLRL